MILNLLKRNDVFHEKCSGLSLVKPCIQTEPGNANKTKINKFKPKMKS